MPQMYDANIDFHKKHLGNLTFDNNHDPQVPAYIMVCTLNPKKGLPLKLY